MRALATPWLTLSLLLLPDTLLTQLVISSSLVRIAQYFVGIGDFLEFLLGSFGVVQVLVGMILDGFLLECFLEGSFIYVALHTQQIIIVLRRVRLLLLLLLLLSLLLLSLLLLSLLLLLLLVELLLIESLLLSSLCVDECTWCLFILA